MRMQAKVQLQYGGNTYDAGDLFDAPHDDALDLRNKEMAVPFHLEDPAFRKTEAPPPKPPGNAVP